MSDLSGRVAIVTGSTRGLGEAFVRALHAAGAAVAVTGRNGDRAREIASELDATAATAIGLDLDVRDRGSFGAVVDAVHSRLGRLDILVNNAGVTPARPLLEIGDDEWDEVLQTNLRSVLIGCQLAAPLMKAQGFGRIVNHGSIAGQQGSTVAGAHYAASKAGIHVLTKMAARELAPHGITVNTIAPAAIAGPIMDELPAETIDRLPGLIPVGRVGTAEEVAALVVFLCSDAAGYMTGTTVDVNGGLFMR